MKKMLLVSLLLVVLAGCTMTTDLETGQRRVGLDLPFAEKIEAVAEGGIAIGPLFGVTGAAAGGILAGILGVWRKVKPKLTEAKTESEQYHAAGSALTEAIDAFKKSNPVDWQALKSQIECRLTKQGLNPLAVENVIRGLRGLPEKA